MKIIRNKNIKFIPASHEDPKDPGVWKKVLIDKNFELRGKIMMVNWAKLPKDRSFEPHYHEDMVEVFILVKGRAKMKVGDEEEVMDKGDLVVVPAKKVHVMTNIGKVNAEYIVFGVSSEDKGKTINI